MEIIGCVWFLKTLFACYLVARVAKSIKLPVEIMFLLSWIVLLFIPYGGTLMINFLYFYFCIGYFIHKYQGRIQAYRAALFFGSAVFFIVSVCCHRAVPCAKVDAGFILHSPMAFVLQLLVGLSGSIVVIGLCEIVYKMSGKGQVAVKVLSKLSTVGRYTLGIYVVQTFLIERTLTTFVKLRDVVISSAFTDFVLIPLTGCVACFVCYHVVRLTQRNRLINFLFYGGQKD